MSNSESSSDAHGFDMGQFEAEFDDAAELHEARVATLNAVYKLWDRIEHPNETLPTARKFIISETPNDFVPVAHESVLLVPKPRATKISGVESLTVRVPYLHAEPRAERRLDPRFAFIELERPDGVFVSHLLSQSQYATYYRSTDIHIAEIDGDRTYFVGFDSSRSVRTGAGILSFDDIDGDFTPTSLQRPPSELTELTELITLLQTYDPDLQDNLPYKQT